MSPFTTFAILVVSDNECSHGRSL